MVQERRSLKIAAVGDVHYGKGSQGTLHTLFAAANEVADIFVLAGDLTDYGLPDEARLLAKDLSSVVRIPIVAVLGNHDFESGKQEEIASILTDVGVSVLDGATTEVHGVGFAGVKGFAGGFGRGALGPWGENTIKLFVREAIDEALKLETALARLRTPQRVAVLHYAPVRATVEGEPLEIFPYMGSGRLEEPLIRYPVTLVLHGHAHHGQVEGRTSTGTPVYNVSLPLMRERYPDRWFQIVEIAPSVETPTEPAAAR
jgi:Icc-related predicted phosphoesterase